MVDDEPRYLRLVGYNLESSGYKVIAAADGDEALRGVARGNVDLVILDIRLPGMDGCEVCRRIREFSTVPIIMLTAKGEDSDKVLGLSSGADDYVTKPFYAEELLARVEAVLRRSHFSESTVPQPTRAWGKMSIDFAQRLVTVGGQEVRLSPTEYRLLRCLAANAGRVVARAEILEKVWGPGYREPFEGLRAYIRRLRQKIETDPGKPEYILTRAGIGYLLSLPHPPSSTIPPG